MTPSPDNGSLILIVDDDRTLGHLLKSWLEKEGYRVQTYTDGQSCLAALAHTLPDAICLDLHMPGMTGIETLERIKSRHPLLPVLILTSDTQVESIVGAMRVGAYDYLQKPVDRHDLTNRVRHALDGFEMSLKIAHLERTAEGKSYPGMVGKTPAMTALYRQMDRLTSSDITLLIQGESGSGKELVARAIHQQSGRASGPFVPVNCAAIPETLQESELFGHEKGSFTGATGRRIGKFEQADRGTLFMDEIGELSLPAQAKLLRVLQERSFTRVGGTSELSSDFRLIAATHRDLSKMVADGAFREDLYFRVAVFELAVPPLRDRSDDIADLAKKFLVDFASMEGRQPPVLAEGALYVLSRYSWPGNVRELQNAVQRALVITDSEVIDAQHLPPRILDSVGETRAFPAVEELASDAAAEGIEQQAWSAGIEVQHESSGSGIASARRETKPIQTLEDMERDAIAAALERADGNLSRACRELGIGRTTLYRKIKKYELR